MNLQDFKFPSVSSVDAAFSTFDTIPELLKEAKDRGMDKHTNRYNKMFNDMFFAGLKGASFKEGLSEDFKTNALAYMRAYARSFAPKHEHKEAVCALIMSELFD